MAELLEEQRRLLDSHGPKDPEPTLRGAIENLAVVAASLGDLPDGRADAELARELLARLGLRQQQRLRECPPDATQATVLDDPFEDLGYMLDVAMCTAAGIAEEARDKLLAAHRAKRTQRGVESPAKHPKLGAA